MIVRVVLFRVRPGVTEEDYLALLAAFKTAMTNVPGLLSYQIGRRIDSGVDINPVADTEAGQYEYALIYQFASEAALRMYLRRPALEELRKHLAQVCDSTVSGDYNV